MRRPHTHRFFSSKCTAFGLAAVLFCALALTFSCIQLSAGVFRTTEDRLAAKEAARDIPIAKQTCFVVCKGPEGAESCTGLLVDPHHVITSCHSIDVATKIFVVWNKEVLLAEKATAGVDPGNLRYGKTFKLNAEHARHVRSVEKLATKEEATEDKMVDAPRDSASWQALIQEKKDEMQAPLMASANLKGNTMHTPHGVFTFKGFDIAVLTLTDPFEKARDLWPSLAPLPVTPLKDIYTAFTALGFSDLIFQVSPQRCTQMTNAQKTPLSSVRAIALPPVKKFDNEPSTQSSLYATHQVQCSQPFQFSLSAEEEANVPRNFGMPIMGYSGGPLVGKKVSARGDVSWHVLGFLSKDERCVLLDPIFESHRQQESMCQAMGMPYVKPLSVQEAEKSGLWPVHQVFEGLTAELLMRLKALCNKE